MSDLAEFGKKIALIQPKGLNAYGTGIPGIGGASIANRGGSTESDVTTMLNRDVHELLAAISANEAQDLLKQKKQKVEGHLRSCNIVGLITDEELNALLDELQELGEQ